MAKALSKLSFSITCPSQPAKQLGLAVCFFESFGPHLAVSTGCQTVEEYLDTCVKTIKLPQGRKLPSAC